MASILEGTLNARVIAETGSRLLVRSDAPVDVTAADVAWLLEHGVTTLIDLRSASEVERVPVPLAGDSRFAYENMPVTGGNVIPATPEQVPASYIAMVDAQMAGIVHRIESAPGGVLWFCSAGKDRTGVVSAIVLSRLGVSRQEIVDDYVESAGNLREALEGVARRRPEARLDVMIPRRQTMERFLDWYKAHPLP